MKPDKNKILIASGAVLGATAVFGTAAYLTTKFLMKTAIDREGPKMMTHATNRIAGSLISEEVFKRVADAAAKLEAAPTERVEIQGFDDITLVGHWYPAQNPKRIVVAMHGWRSSWSSDFGLMADFLHDNDCSVLFAEQPYGLRSYRKIRLFRLGAMGNRQQIQDASRISVRSINGRDYSFNGRRT